MREDDNKEDDKIDIELETENENLGCVVAMMVGFSFCVGIICMAFIVRGTIKLLLHQ